jgi:hypothetical protein
MSTFANRFPSIRRNGRASCAPTRPLQLDRLFRVSQGPLPLPNPRIRRWPSWLGELLLWFARSSGAFVVDASSVVCAVHQNHACGYHPHRRKMRLGRRRSATELQAARPTPKRWNLAMILSPSSEYRGRLLPVLRNEARRSANTSAWHRGQSFSSDINSRQNPALGAEEMP